MVADNIPEGDSDMYDCTMQYLSQKLVTHLSTNLAHLKCKSRIDCEEF